MKPVCVAVYDRKAEVFQSPFFVSDLAAAERSYISFIASGDSVPAQWPEDFDLYQLGAFDPRTGELCSLERPSLVITGQSAQVAASRFMRQRGGELSGGKASFSPPEDSAASAERNKMPSDSPGTVTSQVLQSSK